MDLIAANLADAATVTRAASVSSPNVDSLSRATKLKPEPLPDIEWHELDESDGTVLLLSTRNATIWAENQPRKKVLWTLPDGGFFGDFCLYQEGLTQPCRLLWNEPPGDASDPWDPYDWTGTPWQPRWSPTPAGVSVKAARWSVATARRAMTAVNRRSPGPACLSQAAGPLAALGSVGEVRGPRGASWLMAQELPVNLREDGTANDDEIIRELAHQISKYWTQKPMPLTETDIGG